MASPTTRLPLLSFERPYSADMVRSSGVYRFQVGPFYYLGSTECFGKRRSGHRELLLKGTHPNPGLQAAWDKHLKFEMIIVEEIPRKPREPDKDFTQRLKLHEQWLLDDYFGTEFCTNLSANSGFNTGISDTLKEMWRDPVFREKQMALMQEGRKANPLSDAARKKMGDSKRGSRNKGSRPCIACHNGKWFKFACGSDAAKHFGVSQQRMAQWLTGKHFCPGHPCSRKSSRNIPFGDLMVAFSKPIGDGGSEYNARYFLDAICGKPKFT